jgi:F-type H+-transporting ATPase subunit delta
MKTTMKTRRLAKRLFHLCLVDESLDEQRARHIASRVLTAKRRGYLVLLHEFQRLLKLNRANHTAEIQSVEPLPDDLRLRIETDVEQKYGSGLIISFAQEPSLIGGMRVRVGSDVYDSSIRARLAALDKSFRI